MPRDSALVDLLVSIADRADDRRSWHGKNLRGALRGLPVRALRDAIRGIDPETLERPLPGKKTSRSELVTGVAAHDVYHAGQIQRIKRLMRTGANARRER